jgi:hypothetical protein
MKDKGKGERKKLCLSLNPLVVDVRIFLFNVWLDISENIEGFF